MHRRISCQMPQPAAEPNQADLQMGLPRAIYASFAVDLTGHFDYLCIHACMDEVYYSKAQTGAYVHIHSYM